MKKLLHILLCLPIISLGQYSNYYNINKNIDANINKNVNVSGTVNKNVNVSGTVNKNVNVSGTVRNTITTIDYGALANANAQREANRLTEQKLAIEQAQYRDAKERNNAILYANRALEIADDPMKAHTYGLTQTSTLNYQNENWGQLRVTYGFLSFDHVFTVPHASLFENVGSGRFENISSDGITTEIVASVPNYNYRNFPSLSYEESNKYQARIITLNKYYTEKEKPKKRKYKKNKDAYKKDLERYYEVCDSLDNWGYVFTPKTYSKYPSVEVKSMFLNSSGDSVYCHKKEVVKRLVYGHKGFRSTIIWEDDYEICITDNYQSLFRDVLYEVTVRYKADKNSALTFEDLEGRRFYLSKFIDKNIATRKLTNMVFVSGDLNKPKRRSYSSSEDFNKAFYKWKDAVLLK